MNLLIATFAAWGCTAPGQPVHTPTETEVIEYEGPGLVVSSLVHARPSDAVLDDYLIVRPRHLLLHEGRLYVVDAETSRVLVFDTTLTPQYAFGRRGQGPAELGRPAYLQVQADSILVADEGNGRISVFTREGEYVRSRRRQAQTHSGAFAVLGPDSFAAVGSEGGGRLAVYGQGRMAPQLVEYGDRTAVTSTLPSQDLVIAAESRLFYLDAREGRILELDEQFGITRVLDLPDLLHNVYAERVRRGQELIGDAGVVQLPYFMSAQALPEGRLFLFLGPRFPILGLLIELESATAVQILAPPESAGLTTERWRLAGILDRHLYVVSNDGDLLVFELRTDR